MNIFSRNKIRAQMAIRRSDKLSKWHLVCDVDGVLTDGKFHYSSAGKTHKVFGSHDADALKEDEFFEEVTFISADKRGFEISSRRIEDMGFKLQLKSSGERVELIRELERTSRVVFVGDSFSDVPALKEATLSAAPRNAYPEARKKVDIRLKLNGGEGAIAELMHLLRSLDKRGLF